MYMCNHRLTAPGKEIHTRVICTQYTQHTQHTPT